MWHVEIRVIPDCRYEKFPEPRNYQQSQINLANGKNEKQFYNRRNLGRGLVRQKRAGICCFPNLNNVYNAIVVYLYIICVI